MRFYRIEQPKAGSRDDHTGRSDAIQEAGFNVGDSFRCPKCNRPLSMREWLPPYRIELETWGKHYGDVVEIGRDMIVSEHFRQIFTGSSLKGLLCFEPVQVVKVVHRRGKPTNPPPKYYKAEVIRSQTTIDQDASGFVWADKKNICSECLFDTLKRYRCLIVNEESWSGEDVFYPRGGMGPLVSERFREVFVENGMMGAVFIPSDSPEAGYDSFPWESEDAKMD